MRLAVARVTSCRTIARSCELDSSSPPAGRINKLFRVWNDAGPCAVVLQSYDVFARMPSLYTHRQVQAHAPVWWNHRTASTERVGSASLCPAGLARHHWDCPACRRQAFELLASLT